MFGVRRVAGVAVICVLVVLAVGLVGAAVIRRHHHDTVHSLGSGGIPTTVNRKVAAVYVTATSTQPSPVLTILDATKALYAMSGCHGPGQLFGTDNGGLKWGGVPSPSPHILRVQIVGPTRAWVIGANSSCHPTYYSVSTTSTAGWVPSSSIGPIWFLAGRGIHLPSGRISTPCGTTTPDPVALAPAGTQRALVVCSEGVFRTQSSGRTWNPTGAVPFGHPVNIALTTGGRGVLLLDGASGCKGLRVALTSNAGKSWRAGPCLSQLGPPAGVALSSTGVGLATIGTSLTYSTTDFGVSWRLAGS